MRRYPFSTGIALALSAQRKRKANAMNLNDDLDRIANPEFGKRPPMPDTPSKEAMEAAISISGATFTTDDGAGIKIQIARIITAAYKARLERLKNSIAAADRRTNHINNCRSNLRDSYAKLESECDTLQVEKRELVERMQAVIDMLENTARGGGKTATEWTVAAADATTMLRMGVKRQNIPLILQHKEATDGK